MSTSPAGNPDFGTILGNLGTGNAWTDISTNYSGTKGTTTTGIDYQGMQYLLNQILGATGGLAEVSKGEKDSGLYNSSVDELLVNNLLTQAAGYAASKNVTTTSDTKTASNDSPFSALGKITVICTELHRQGITSTEDYEAGQKWSAKNVPEQMLRGYQFWAIPYVRLMRKYKWATRLFIPITHGRYDWILRNHWTLGGYIAMKILAPLSYFIGYFVCKQDYQSLYVNENS